MMVNLPSKLKSAQCLGFIYTSVYVPNDLDVVKSKLAACVNIVPAITSVYEWQGKLEEESELLLIMKTKSSALNMLKEKVISLHPYEVPEFIAAPIEYGSEKYLKWIDTQVI
ncbi:unnamed protein product [Dracunculus medinensis]|uniref:Divalent-cation tolerance protein CutA n=1 Tax=Dracunculus medinensis TaxID=318479 RepID=A0A0N4U688_DRAME|nr:unnamed protein product [Dracunculus medinensis]